MNTKTIRPRSVTALITGILLLALTAQSSMAEQERIFTQTYKKGTHGFTLDDEGYEGVLLTVTCGDERGENRVPSAVVIVNGKVLLKPRHFNQNVETLSRGLDGLWDENGQMEVEVTVGGKHDATLYLEVTATRKALQQTVQPALRYVTWYRDGDFDGVGCDFMKMDIPEGVPPPPPSNSSQWVTLAGDCNGM